MTPPPKVIPVDMRTVPDEELLPLFVESVYFLWPESLEETFAGRTVPSPLDGEAWKQWCRDHPAEVPELIAQLGYDMYELQPEDMTFGYRPDDPGNLGYWRDENWRHWRDYPEVAWTPQQSEP